MSSTKLSAVSSVERAKPTALQHTLASQCGGALSTILLYPIDVVRMRFMSQDGTQWRQHNGQTYHRIWRSFCVIYQQEGGLRPFFRGCHVSVIGTVCAWGIYMYVYRGLCNVVDSVRFGSRGADEAGSALAGQQAVNDLLRSYGLSIVASCVSAVFCNPIWLLKTRMQLEESTAALGGSALRHYRTFIGGLRHTVRETGVRSLWRGVSAQMLLAVPNAFNLPTYDAIKSMLLLFTPERSTLSPPQVLVCSTVTKVALGVVCHPIMVLKVRLQDHRARVGDVRYETLGQSAATIWRENGLRGMYRGMVPSLCQTVPRSVLMFLFYEQFLNLFTNIRFAV